jgi:hypothetical protein
MAFNFGMKFCGTICLTCRTVDLRRATSLQGFGTFAAVAIR